MGPRDAAAAVGLTLLGAGVALVYVPAALIAVGALLVAMSIRGGRR